jgi:beta-phosphoglucomutase-like phosphatase (HAD superfamily)
LPEPPLEGLLLDFDGLVVDTETPIFEEWQAAYRERGHTLGLDLWQHALGTKGGFDPCAHLSSLVGPGLDCDALRGEVWRRSVERCAAQPLLPGVLSLLEEARGLGVKAAVASSSSRGWVSRWLEHHGIGSLIEAICGREDVAKVKPDPELFLLAASRLGAAPAGCLVFEDSPNGVLAARRAGMRCVAVPNALTRGLDLRGPDLVLSSVSDLPLAAIARQLGLDSGRASEVG